MNNCNLTSDTNKGCDSCVEKQYHPLIANKGTEVVCLAGNSFLFVQIGEAVIKISLEEALKSSPLVMEVSNYCNANIWYVGILKDSNGYCNKVKFLNRNCKPTDLSFIKQLYAELDEFYNQILVPRFNKFISDHDVKAEETQTPVLNQ